MMGYEVSEDNFYFGKNIILICDKCGRKLSYFVSDFDAMDKSRLKLRPEGPAEGWMMPCEPKDRSITVLCPEHARKWREQKNDYRKNTEKIEVLFKRNEAMRPTTEIIREDGYDWKYYHCASCERILENDGTERFCPNCGQRLDWRKEKEQKEIFIQEIACKPTGVEILYTNGKKSFLEYSDFFEGA